MRKGFFLIPLFFLFFSTARSQSFSDSLSFLKKNYSKPLLSSDFDKQLNTYSSQTLLDYQHETQNFFFGVSEKYATTLIRSSVNHVKSENNFNALGELKLFNYLSAGILLNSNIYSDDRKLTINSAELHNASLFSKFHFAKVLKLIPFAGLSVNQQVGERDKGYIYGTEMNLNNLNFLSSDFFVNAKFLNEDVLPRRNMIREVLAKMENRLNDFSFNLLSLGYNQKRKDFYFAADSLTKENFGITNNIQTRTETKYLLTEHFKFKYPNSNWLFNFKSKIFWRDIDRSTRYILLENVSSSTFDSDIKELKLDFNADAAYSVQAFKSYFRINYAERNEIHSPKMIAGVNPIFYEEREKAEKQKNNKSQLVTLYTSFSYDVTSKDKILFNLLHRKLRYDTPSEENYDDRDELLSLFRLRYERRFSSFFNFFVETEGSFNHIVYIFAQRSSNNNKQRVLKLSSGGGYFTPRLKTVASAEVSANYTVYDFEDINPNIKSFVFRQFAMRDSTILRLTSLADFRLNGYVKLSEQGDFKWDDFKSRPSRYVEEVYAVSELLYHRKKITFGAGIRYFSLTTFRYDNNFNLRRVKSYKSIGPLSEIGISIRKFLFSLYGWYEFITYEDNSKRELVNLKVKLKWNF